MIQERYLLKIKGSFLLRVLKGVEKSDILYAYDDKRSMIYFTPKGIVYCLQKRVQKKEADEDEGQESIAEKSHAEKEAEERNVSFITDAIYFTWENANPDVRIIAEDPATDYFSYYCNDNSGDLKNINYIKGYNKIIYKNLYPLIDVEYVFHPGDGIEYSLILHPGADISNVKMNYSGNTKLIGNGEIHIYTLFGNMIEHAPVAFYEDQKSALINAHFTNSGNSLSFD